MASKGIKKQKIVCPNPIFEKWIIEMRNDAIARDLHSKHTLTKCLNSLRKYPLPLSSGKECIILEGFGDKICQIIDKKVEQFLADGGNLHEESTNLVNENELQKNYNDLEDKYKDKSKLKEKRKNLASIEIDEKSPIAKKQNIIREYKPEFRSGAYALLITLLKHEDEKGNDKEMLKTELIKNAQKHCDASFTSSDGMSHYTAWSSMSTLIKKELILKSNTSPAKYCLTDSGRDLALKLVNNDDRVIDNIKLNSSQKIYNKEYTKVISPIINNDNDSDGCEIIYNHDNKLNEIESMELKSLQKSKNTHEAIIIDSNSDSEKNDCINNIHKPIKSFEIDKKIDTLMSTSHSSLNINSINPNDILISLPADTYEIILIVDTCETSHAKRQELFLKELEKSDIKYEISKLNIGDFAWVARSKTNSFENTDIVLDYIVERKRVDDLCQSIIDGRYKEQKFRLKRCGINNIIYLIEQYGSMKNFSLPESSIKQAIVNTQIIDEFYVKETLNVKDSCNYLVDLTKNLIEIHRGLKLNACLKEKIDDYYGKFSNKIHREKPHIYLLTFQEFNQNSNKNKPPTVKEMFGRFLIQVNGLSQDKVISILDKYPTPTKLFNAYKDCENESQRIKLLANLKYGKQNRNLGPALSKLLAMLFFK